MHTFLRAIAGLLLVVFASSVFAQTDNNTPSRTCITDEIHTEKMATDPAYQRAWQNRQDRLQQRMQSVTDKVVADCPDPVVMPVAVHFQNVSAGFDLQCLRDLAIDQVQILNDDYQGINADIVDWSNGTSSAFPGISNGESCIQFCLATRNHPGGYDLQDGDVAVTINGSSGSFDGNWSGYINIFVRNIGALGFSPLGGNGNGDGVTIDNRAFGSGAGCSGFSPASPFDLGRTVTHEMGHYLDLNHIWGGGCGADDGIEDTPNQADSYGGCPSINSSSCGSTDMHMNYMDYVNDRCMYMFSALQVSRMDNYAAANLQNVIGNNDVLDCDGSGGGNNNAVVQFTEELLSVEEGTSSCFEGGFRVLSIPVSVFGLPSAATTVDVEVSGTALEGIDFDLNTPQLIFPAEGTEPQFIELVLYEDAVPEQDANILLSLSINAFSAGESNVALGDIINTTVALTNDDFAPGLESEIQVDVNTFSGFADHELGPQSTVYFRDANTGAYMVKLTNQSDFYYGCITVEVDREAGGSPGATASSAAESEWLTNKTFFITPEFNNPNGSYEISLYYTAEEISRWSASVAEPEGNLRMVKSNGTITFAPALEVLNVSTESGGEFFTYTANVTTGFSGGFALGGMPASLPVEWLGFTATGGEKTISLDWQTALETDNDGFEVLRSTSGTDGFTSIGWVPGAGTSTESQAYNLEDETVIPGETYFYQLRQTDVDGTLEYSSIVSASLPAGAGSRLEVSPNPFGAELTFNLAAVNAGAYQLLHVDGRMIQQGAFSRGFQRQTISMNTVPSGVYFLVVQIGEERLIRKVVKQVRSH
ncbi:zinc-dependent metalloprotease [Neolewinella persica]|uniref:zinc-dependent metalloprotease n=1 Tax=Neolewinella persica TaxID=70998 RepID=UPI00037BABBB|nr:zinc-dependent metalloprotease [Neolewinella persica]